MTKFWNSSTARFILLVFGIQLILSAGITLTLRTLTRLELEEDAQTYARMLSRDMAEAYRVGGDNAAQRMATLRLVFSEGRAAIILLTDDQGRPLAGNLQNWPAKLQPGWNEINVVRPGAAPAQLIGVIATTLPGGRQLLTGQVLASDQRLSRIVDRATGTALIFALPLALLAAFVAVRIINARVNDIADTATAVRAGQFSRRVSLDGSGDTFDRLGGTLNAMLDQIETLISELRIVTDGLAHDLRSPLTRLKARLERAEVEHDPARLRQMLHHAGAEADHLLGMLATALLISRAEAGIGRDHFDPVDLGALIEDLGELYQPLAEERGVDLLIQISGACRINGNRELLGQAISNGIDNAFKYGAGPMRLTAWRKGPTCWVEMADTGPGIPEDLREEALRRFGRLDPARSGSGVGLGLSLISAVVRLHGGTFELDDARPGLIIRMAFPALPSNPGEHPLA